MKRVKAACICQTLHFMTREEGRPEDAILWVRQEVEQYKRGLERNQVRYRILEEREQPDGSMLVKVVKQYNNSPVGDYLDGYPPAGGKKTV